jgi:hypothetical protein
LTQDGQTRKIENDRDYHESTLSKFRPRTDRRALNQKRKGLDTMARILYKIFDYVIRRFNAPSAGLKSGLNLR